MAWSPIGQVLATPDDEGTILISEGQTLAPKARLSDPRIGTARVNAVGFNSDGSLLAACGDFRYLLIFRLRDESVVAKCELDSSRNHGLCWSPDDKYLIGTSVSGQLVVRCTSDCSVYRRIPVHAGWINWVVSSIDGETLYSAGGDEDCRLVASSLRTGDMLWSLQCAAAVLHCARSRVGDQIAAVTKEGRLVVADARSGREIMKLRVSDSETKCVGFSWDDRLLAVKSDDHTVKLIDAATWQVVAQIDERTSRWPAGLAFHPNQPMLATLGVDNSRPDTLVRLWEYDTRAPHRPYADAPSDDRTGHELEGTVESTELTAGNELIAATADKTIDAVAREPNTFPPAVEIPKDATLTPPMQLKQLAAIAGMTARRFKKYVARKGSALLILGRQEYQLWLDPLDVAMRARFESTA